MGSFRDASCCPCGTCCKQSRSAGAGGQFADAHSACSTWISPMFPSTLRCGAIDLSGIFQDAGSQFSEGLLESSRAIALLSLISDQSAALGAPYSPEL